MVVRGLIRWYNCAAKKLNADPYLHVRSSGKVIYRLKAQAPSRKNRRSSSMRRFGCSSAR